VEVTESFRNPGFVVYAPSLFDLLAPSENINKGIRARRREFAQENTLFMNKPLSGSDFLKNGAAFCYLDEKLEGRALLNLWAVRDMLDEPKSWKIKKDYFREECAYRRSRKNEKKVWI
jgi:hypothetical protein